MPDAVKLVLMALPLIFLLAVIVVPLAVAVLPVPKVPLVYNLRNLTVRWWATLVTALAFTIVVGLFCLMLALALGMIRLTENSGHPGNVIILQDGATDEAFSRLPPSAGVRDLPADIQAQIKKRNFLINADLPSIPEEQLRELAKKNGINVGPAWSWQELTEAIHEKLGVPYDLGTKEVYVIVNQTIRGAPPGFHIPSKTTDELLELALSQGLDVETSWSHDQLAQAIHSAGKRRRFVQMRGLDNPEVAGWIHGIRLLSGRWFSQSGVQPIARKGREQTKAAANLCALSLSATSTPLALTAVAGINQVESSLGKLVAYELVIGEGAAQEFGKDRNLGRALQPGDLLDIGPRTWVIVGVMKSLGSTFGSEVWARDSLVGRLFGKENSYTSYVIRTNNAKSASKVAEDLRKEKLATPVQALPETEYYAKLQETNQGFLITVIIVAVFMAIGGGLGVMNTMFAAISQRTKDIGVLRMLGFRRWQILMSFLLESLLIALIGGLAGCAISYLFNGWTMTSIVTSGQGGGGKGVIVRLLVDWWVMMWGMGFALVMGALGGLVPSLSAMRLKPLESLR
jgi:cell division protein FtsX